MRYIFVFTLLFSVAGLQAQEKRDTLKTEEIIVVKPYTPKISDAFKVKANPVIGENEFEKEHVTYSIFSFPVASTFTPSKGRAQRIQRGPKERLFENYISAGFGNFTSPLLEAYIHAGDSRTNDFGLFVNHHSSEGGIDKVLLDDRFSKTHVDMYYKQIDRHYNWQLNAGVARNLINYYGLSTEMNYDQTFLDGIDEQQIYKNIYVGGMFNLEDSFFKGVSAEMMNFTDDYNSNEFRLLVKPKVEFPISSELINVVFSTDLITGKFRQSYFDTEDLKHSFFTLGASPNFEVLRDHLSVNLGAKLYYANDLENKTNEFYAYPNVTASLQLIEDVLIINAGATGDLVQNSYKNFSEENPYMSPTASVFQTDKQYKAFFGAKGKIAMNMGYHFSISHTYEKNKPLFLHNQTKTDGMMAISEAYEAGNSFGLVYDNVKTLGGFAEVTIDASKEFNFATSLEIARYDTETELEAWNLPRIKATISANYQNNSWFAGAKLFHIGKTKDMHVPFGATPGIDRIIENESYIDLNLNGGYIFSDRLTAFARINNALGEKYHRFVNYQVQTLQMLAGITYKFDLD